MWWSKQHTLGLGASLTTLTCFLGRQAAVTLVVAGPGLMGGSWQGGRAGVEAVATLTRAAPPADPASTKTTSRTRSATTITAVAAQTVEGTEKQACNTINVDYLLLLPLLHILLLWKVVLPSLKWNCRWPREIVTMVDHAQLDRGVLLVTQIPLELGRAGLIVEHVEVRHHHPHPLPR